MTLINFSSLKLKFDKTNLKKYEILKDSETPLKVSDLTSASGGRGIRSPKSKQLNRGRTSQSSSVSDQASSHNIDVLSDFSREGLVSTNISIVRIVLNETLEKVIFISVN